MTSHVYPTSVASSSVSISGRREGGGPAGAREPQAHPETKNRLAEAGQKEERQQGPDPGERRNEIDSVLELEAAEGGIVCAGPRALPGFDAEAQGHRDQRTTPGGDPRGERPLADDALAKPHADPHEQGGRTEAADSKVVVVAEAGRPAGQAGQ